MHLSFDESTHSCLRDDNNNDPTFIPHTPEHIVEKDSKDVEVSVKEPEEDLAITEVGFESFPYIILCFPVV